MKANLITNFRVLKVEMLKSKFLERQKWQYLTHPNTVTLYLIMNKNTNNNNELKTGMIVCGLRLQQPV